MDIRGQMTPPPPPQQTSYHLSFKSLSVHILRFLITLQFLLTNYHPHDILKDHKIIYSNIYMLN